MMRKVYQVASFDEKTLDPILNVFMVDEQGIKTQLLKDALIEQSKYSPEEQQTISKLNKVLADNNQPVLTEAESDWALRRHWQLKDPDPTEIQQLAGFRVEKTVVLLK